MLKASSVAEVKELIRRVFNAEPHIFVSIKGTAVQYEVMIYLPYCANYGRGVSLRAAAQHLIDRNKR